MNYKGIILSGGLGTRLYPATIAVSKQLLPVYDKPMIYYSLSTLMLAGIRDILLITTSKDLLLYKQLLGNGNNWGVNITYCVQKSPDGLAQAFILGADFIGQSPTVLILGDNIFYGNNFANLMYEASIENIGATIFAYYIKDPERYGVVEFDKNNFVTSLEEKPKRAKSNYAVTGLYFYNNDVVSLAKKLKPSSRGELEITDLNKLYLSQNALKLKVLERGYAWFDTGSHESLLEASQYVASIENRQGLKICCPEEIAWRKGWIDDNQFEQLAMKLPINNYRTYLIKLLSSECIIH